MAAGLAFQRSAHTGVKQDGEPKQNRHQPIARPPTMTSMQYLTEREDLQRFLETQGAPVLRQVLLELAERHPAVYQRLLLLEQAHHPEALAALLTKQLDRWRCDDRYVELADGSAFINELDEWLSQVQAVLMPTSPRQALRLLEDFIRLDGQLFEWIDDSGDALGSVFREACELWGQAAYRAGLEPGEIRARAAALAADDGYGVRAWLRSGIGVADDDKK